MSTIVYETPGPISVSQGLLSLPISPILPPSVTANETPLNNGTPFLGTVWITPVPETPGVFHPNMTAASTLLQSPNPQGGPPSFMHFGGMVNQFGQGNGTTSGTSVSEQSVAVGPEGPPMMEQVEPAQAPSQAAQQTDGQPSQQSSSPAVQKAAAPGQQGAQSAEQPGAVQGGTAGQPGGTSGALSPTNGGAAPRAARAGRDVRPARRGRRWVRGRDRRVRRRDERVRERRRCVPDSHGSRPGPPPARRQPRADRRGTPLDVDVFGRGIRG
ncbi:MAG: hypothetical protein ACLQGP_30250 [Isosphaeraceae bacterium]